MFQPSKESSSGVYFGATIKVNTQYSSCVTLPKINIRPVCMFADRMAHILCYVMQLRFNKPKSHSDFNVGYTTVNNMLPKFKLEIILNTVALTQM